MVQARKRLVELLTEAEYITSEDSNYTWWERIITLGAVNNNYSYDYLYSIKTTHDGKNGTFTINQNGIWNDLNSELNISYKQMEDLIIIVLGVRYNFGDIIINDLEYVL